MSAAFLFIGAAVLAVSLVVLKAGTVKQLRVELVGYRLQFPARLEAAAESSPRSTANTTCSFCSGDFFEGFADTHLLAQTRKHGLCKKR